MCGIDIHAEGEECVAVHYVSLWGAIENGGWTGIGITEVIQKEVMGENWNGCSRGRAG